MAITNAQQYQQLVNKPADGKRPGYRGVGGYRGGSGGSGGKGGREAPGSKGGSPSERDFSTGPNVGRDPNEKPAVDRSTEQQTINQLRATNRYVAEDEDLFPGDVPDERVDIPLTDNEQNFYENRDLFINKPANYGKYVPAGLQMLADLNRKPNRKFFYERVLRNNAQGLNYTELEKAYQEYMQGRMSGKTDAMGRTIVPSGRDDDPIIPIIPQDQLLPDMPEEDSTEDDFLSTAREKGILARRFRADGGIMNENIIGGMMDGNMDEMGRQMYGLGKLVKKVTRGVKKIVKSPLGKAAIAGYFLGGGSLGGILKSRPGFSFANLGSSLGLGRLSMGPIADEGMIFRGGKFSNLANIVRDKLSSTGGKFLAGSTLASLLPFFGLGTGDESEEEAKRILDNSGISEEEFNKLRNDIDYQNSVLNRRSRAGGGIMRLGYQEGGDAEPVAKKTMPLLDMDGMEKDYRETGGFVEMGRMERADDVPARLSKNEFVFTADAVRNAGDGDIDKGAEVMYNMMKNLEDGGDVSEESQGLEGARKMFQTSQRLEEVL